MTPFPLAVLITFATVLSSLSIVCDAGETVPHLTVGTQEIGLSAGYLISSRLTDQHSTKQSGPAIMPSLAMASGTPHARRRNRLHPVSGTGTYSWGGIHAEDQVDVRRHGHTQTLHR